MEGWLDPTPNGPFGSWVRQHVIEMYDEMISLALQLKKAKDRVEALVYLQENYDELMND